MDDFRQKAKQSFKLGLDFVHKKAQQTLESTRLHSQLRQAQEQKQQALLTLGERVCVMFDMDRFQAEELKDGVEQVRQLQAEIQALEKRIQEIGHEEAEAQTHADTRPEADPPPDSPEP